MIQTSGFIGRLCGPYLIFGGPTDSCLLGDIACTIVRLVVMACYE